jgi:hypothetical protein
LRRRKAKDVGLWTLKASVGSEVSGSIDQKAHTEPGEHREGVMTRFFMTTISSLYDFYLPGYLDLNPENRNRKGTVFYFPLSFVYKQGGTSAS